ncbi:aminotransferase class I/II-fold pyridoxal phosphate-dependent enzyme [Shimia biformata]|uniref:aminotransferase class I/II-fold pyridoxal phosphate-dependent enzyme n=1 Tax=Shimia biformata TaxID=1294299 RepID=UPI00194E857D
METRNRDHGGGIDAACLRFGGARHDWLDLSTGINPLPYPVYEFPSDAWTSLPDRAAQTRLIDAARQFWDVPEGFDILPVHGASAAIAALPRVLPGQNVHIPAPTYNEHAAAFDAARWSPAERDADVQVIVHPNNPDGRLWRRDEASAPFTVVDESFCDVAPGKSLLPHLNPADGLVLKSFGKFWGLAGLRLGFVIAAPDIIGAMADATGPWSVSGPALDIGARALSDLDWATSTRARLTRDATRLDRLMAKSGAELAGGTSLFRLYAVDDAATWQERLARAHVWSRIFPYSKTWLRLGLPAPDRWEQLEAAL